ncbi:hypothetical protein AAG570_010900 [Ranatra chinensis]|uniref:UDP-galactose translocator n=1 Tax=Ranatra chinensis TaxID=642074 RepID=A0ABD0YJ71_9HEMI
MRYARTRSGPMFLSSTAVVASELVKLVTCLFLVRAEHKDRWASAVYKQVVQQLLDTLKVCVPSAVYIVQNNLLYVSASHLDAATYQVTYQLKILTTAVFSVLMLKRSLTVHKWLALVVLVAGVALVQISGSDSPHDAPPQNRLLGFSAALGACVLSGFAGVYFEMILKGSDVSVWMRNVQLSLLSLPFGLLTCLLSDWHLLMTRGFFYGYDFFVVYLVILQATGGLLVALVVKYADNILKGFATSLAIVISCVASVYLFGFHITFTFVFGAACVMFSIFLYGYTPQVKKISGKNETLEAV